MKNVILILLILTLFLTGCGTPENPSKETDPESLCKEITPEDPYAENFYGSWHNLTADTVITFREGSLCDITAPDFAGENESFSVIGDGKHVITPWYGLEMESYRGVTCLVVREDRRTNMCYAYTEGNRVLAHGEKMVFVREADYDRVAKEEIVLTLDNWDTYFELREVCWPVELSDASTSAIFLQGIFLKDIYLDRMVYEEPAMDVWFTLKRDIYHCSVEEPFGPSPRFYNESLTRKELEETRQMFDSRMVEGDLSGDPLGKSVYTLFNCGFPIWPGTIYKEVNGSVTAVQGSIWLYPAIE